MKRALLIPALLIISFIGGLFIGEKVLTSLVVWGIVFGGLFAVLLVLYVFRFKVLHARIYFLIITAGLLVSLGALRYQIHRPEFSSGHYLQEDRFTPGVYTFRINEILKSGKYYENYVVKVYAKDRQRLRGKVLLKIAVDTVSSGLRVGDEILMGASLQKIPKPLNPYQFDYSRFMANRGVFRQVVLSSSATFRIIGHRSSLRENADQIRLSLENKLEKADFSRDEKALMEALLLGQRSDLTPEVYQSFIDAGVVHILAISGLHVGILLGFLLLVLKPLTYWRYGQTLRVALVVLLLWGYAFITGLSPSVLRAVAMFSLLSLGLQFNRRVFSFNMLCLSALILLMVNPGYIFEVGFQLSYCAVLSIFIFYRKFFEWLSIKSRFLRYVWRITCVTMAAQVGVLPLSLYYFHQLPGLFFVSNLLIVPFMGILLAVGVLVLLLVSVGLYPPLLFTVFGTLLQLLLKTVRAVAGQQDFKFEHVYFSEGMLILSFLALLLLSFCLYFPKRRRWSWFLGAIIGLQGFYIWEYQARDAVSEFYVFHKTAASVLGWQEGHRFRVVSTGVDEEELPFLDDFYNQKDFTEIDFSRDSLQHFYTVGGQNLWIIRDDQVNKLPSSVSVDIMMLINSPSLNLERLLQKYKPKRLLVDGSNYKSYVNRWKKTAHNHKIPFHYTGEAGYFSLRLSEH